MCFDRCVVPSISVLEPRINLGHQFCTLPFSACIKLVNNSEIPAAYRILPQSEQNEDDVSCLLYCAPEPEVCSSVFSIVLCLFRILSCFSRQTVFQQAFQFTLQHTFLLAPQIRLRCTFINYIYLLIYLPIQDRLVVSGVAV